MNYLVLSEVSRKQDYIFKSNKLLENVGASEIIKYVTEELPQKLLAENNGEDIFQGGGKSLYIFNNEKDALNFISEFSIKVLKDFTGVELFIVKHPFDMEGDDIISEIDKTYEKLAKKKNERKSSIRQISFGIEKKCVSTGFPAADKNNDGKPISKEIKTKLDYAKNNKNDISNVIRDDDVWCKELDDMYKKENNKSYIAVVHIDGNKMGDKFDKFKEQYRSNNCKIDLNYNKEYMKQLKEFSEKIKAAYFESFKDMCNAIYQNIEKLKDVTNIEQHKFPLRSLILAGDDVCFVTYGEIGIECARIFIESLNKKVISIKGGEKFKLNACAGVAIVKAHCPFSKAYELAEQLCANCKNKITQDNKGDYSMIDWHIEQGEISGSISEIRNKMYSLNGCNLNMRPLYINNPDSWRSYQNFKVALKNISSDKAPRSKIKELREVLRQGIDSSEKYIRVNSLENVIQPLNETKGNYGFYVEDNRTCMYFDAIEIMDMFIEFEEV